MTDKEMAQAFEWCEQFTDNLVTADIDAKKRALGLQAMRTCKSALEQLNSAINGQETLQGYVAEKDKEIERLLQKTQQPQAEAYKEFAERLKTKGFIILHHKMILSSDVDNLLKEMKRK